MTLIRRRRSTRQRLLDALPPTRLLAALGGVVTAALGAIIAKRKSRAGAGQPPGPTYAQPSTPEESGARYAETQQTGDLSPAEQATPAPGA